MRLFWVSLLVLGVSMSVFAQDDTYPPMTPDNISEITEIASLRCNGDMVYSAITAFHGTTIAYYCAYDDAGDYDAIIAVYSLESDEVLWQLPAPPSLSNIYFISEDVLLLDRQTSVEIWAADNDTPIFTVDGLLSLTVDTQKQWMAVTRHPIGQNTGMIDVYDLRTLEQVGDSFEYSGMVQVALHEQGQIAIGDGEMGIRVYDVVSGALIAEGLETGIQVADYGDPYSGIAFSPDGTQLLVNQCTVIQMGCWETTITLLDIATAEALQTTAFEYRDMVYSVTQNTVFVSQECDALVALFEIDTLTVMPIPVDAESSCYDDGFSVNQDGSLFAIRDYTETESWYRVYAVADE